MQLAVAGAEFQGFEEERVVEEGEGVEDVEVGLRKILVSGVLGLRGPSVSGMGLGNITFLAKISASKMSAFSRSFKVLSFSSNAFSVA